MGIPKFFRYISERYPLTSQLITENKIPEFDNLYLDFNGIIHNCSHPNDEDAHFRLSEEQIFTSIFAYVDMLFSKIRPKKLFFMAVDGVAPRAKMNQQRSRRFRTAKEAKEVREKAERKGEKLPDEKAFDSNCITPGTVFMAKLSDQLRYFINKKISEDSDWQDIEVVLSGHEVPGEGEHKIMEYIRLARAQQDYDPNVRHCLYGLDADLVMLGLLSHDPHFCLLREEVKFGPARKKTSGSFESINFYLLHLSLIREYLHLEFYDIADTIPFAYDLERIIDDFVLLAVFVGNDFLPNLPDLHIHDNGLEKLFDAYKKVLPSLDGHINESGTINTRRLQVLLDEFTVWEEEVFQKEYSDMNWYKAKQPKHVKEMEVARQRSQLVLTGQQRKIFDQVKGFVSDHQTSLLSSQPTSLTMPNLFSARDRRFMSSLAEKLNLSLSWDEYDDNDQNLVTWRLPDFEVPTVLVEQSQDNEGEVGDGHEEDRIAIDRVLKKYENAPVVEDDDSFDSRHDRTIQQKMDEWKDSYYKTKLNFSSQNEQELESLIFRYVEGLQWVMHYYYSGVASWSWYYNYHYAPRISDLRGIENMEFDFELDSPFLPFQQLMGVLPVASKELIPVAYQDLMGDPNSPILDFYPTEFEQDLNGKKQDWEAIVKIPFINEKRLIAAMKPRDQRLTMEEQKRNSFGTSTRFRYDPEHTTHYPSSLPGFFPELTRCACKQEPFHLPTLDGLHLVEGLCDGVALGTDALAGFPSLNTLRHTAQTGFHGVNVHGSESRNKSVVIHIEQDDQDKEPQELAKDMIGKRMFVGWPFLQEGKVVAVSDPLFKYEMMVVVPGAPAKVISNPHSNQGLQHWNRKAERIEQTYSKRFGVITGPVNALIHVLPLKGLRRVETGAFIKEYEGPDKEVEVAAQMAISEVVSEDPRFLERDAPPLSEEFQEGSKIFFLGEHAYGAAAKVSSTTETTLSVILVFDHLDKTENEALKKIISRRASGIYRPAFKVAEINGLSGRALSRITSSFMVLTSDKQKINLGLNLKFDAKSLKVAEYTRKDGRYWEFSEKAVDLIKEYKAAFPSIFLHLDHSGDEMANVSDVLPGPDPEQKLKEVKAWLKTKGVRDLVPVSLFCDQLPNDKIAEVEKMTNEMYTRKCSMPIKRAIVKGIPRRAVLKPSDSVYRLQNQHFSLGDRVTMVRDSGAVPLSAKGVVVGLNAKTIDVVWDMPFMAGGTLGDRCSLYRGSTVEFNTCLNLSNPQFIASTKPQEPPRASPQVPFRPRFGPRPAIQPPLGKPPASGFRPARSTQPTPVHIMTNPNRNGAVVNGAVNFRSPIANAEKSVSGPGQVPNRETHHISHGGTHISGDSARNGLRPSARGGFGSGSDRGRDAFHRGKSRGRGRGLGKFVAQPQA